MFKNTFAKLKLRYSVYVLVIFWMAVLMQFVVNRFFYNPNRMLEAFADTNSEIQESKLEIVADYGIRYLSETDKADLISFFADKIGLTIDQEIQYKQGETASIMTISKQSKNANTNIEIVSLDRNLGSTETTQGVRQYILIRLTLFQGGNSILVYQDLLKNAFETLEIEDLQCVIKLKGSYDGNLSVERRNEIADKMIDSLQAKIVSQNRTEELYTVYAYTGLVGDYITVSGSKVNLNIVFHYDEEANMTQLEVATPILNEPY